jgi:hypothetical protein
MAVVVPVLEMREEVRSGADPLVVTTATRPLVMDDAAGAIEDALKRNADLVGPFLGPGTRDW